jgi:hypothetical protein
MSCNEKVQTIIVFCLHHTMQTPWNVFALIKIEMILNYQ